MNPSNDNRLEDRLLELTKLVKTIDEMLKCINLQVSIIENHYQDMKQIVWRYSGLDASLEGVQRPIAVEPSVPTEEISVEVEQKDQPDFSGLLSAIRGGEN